MESPCTKGSNLKDVDTPALLVDLDSLEHNIDTMVNMVCALSPSVMIRPHAKASKSVEITRIQIQRSRGRTIGVCCQKICEAVAMVKGGVMDVFVCNEIVSPRKLDTLVDLVLKDRATVSLLVDDASNIDDIVGAIMRNVEYEKDPNRLVFRVLVEVNVGQNRCGVDDIEQVILLAEKLTSYAGILEFGGIQAYNGFAQHAREWSRRKAIIDEVIFKAHTVVDALAAKSIPCPIVTGGGTGTFEFEAASGIFTEIQPGSYSLGDSDYAKNLNEEGEQCWISPFRPALFLLCQVMSRNVSQRRCVVDIGLKGQSTDSGLPTIVATGDQYADLGGGLALQWIKDESGTGGHFDSQAAELLELKSVSDEHTTMTSKDASYLPSTREHLLLFPGPCDPTCNHFDYMVPFRGFTVQDEPWRLHARSPGI